MTNLIRAEFRKILSTNVWWALLIPTVVLAIGWAWVWAALGSSVADTLSTNPGFRSLGVSIDNLPIAGFGLARAINITTIFPMVVGGLAVASEVQRKTLTTTFLTAPSRFSTLAAKLVTYAVLGLGYGLVIVGLASAGIALGASSHTDLLPSAGHWLGIVGTGLLETLLWTLLAVGVGALFGHAIATVLTLVLYSVVAENLLVLVVPGHGPGFFPNQAADGMTSSVAAQAVLDKVGYVPSQFQDGLAVLVRTAAGSKGAFAWWIEALIFLVWAAIFFGFGWWATHRRDVV
jgi:ABC-2 type transport system permease protein